MRFLSMIRINEQAGQVPSEQLMHDMGALIDDMTREGALVRTPDSDRRRKARVCACVKASYRPSTAHSSRPRKSSEDLRSSRRIRCKRRSNSRSAFCGPRRRMGH